MDEVSIPKTLEESLNVLNNILYPDEIDCIKKSTEQSLASFHHTLGRWIRNNWGLWTNSDLRTWFIEHGIDHADDMSGIIINSYWRKLNDRSIDLDEQIQHYQNFWKKI